MKPYEPGNRRPVRAVLVLETDGDADVRLVSSDDGAWETENGAPLSAEAVIVMMLRADRRRTDKPLPTHEDIEGGSR